MKQALSVFVALVVVLGATYWFPIRIPIPAGKVTLEWIPFVYHVRQCRVKIIDSGLSVTDEEFLKIDLKTQLLDWLGTQPEQPWAQFWTPG